MVMLPRLVFVVVGMAWCAGAPLTNTTKSTKTNTTLKASNMTKSSDTTTTSHVRQKRSSESQIDEPSVSPYYADPDGHPPSSCPVLTHQLNPLPLSCQELPGPCNPNAPSPYRTHTGYCNNLKHPHYGTPRQPYLRLLPPAYDSKAVFRTRSVRGHLLPNPRVLSLLLRFSPPGSPSTYNSLMVQMGQFIDHDFSVTTAVKDIYGGKKDCASCSSWQDPACAPIPLPYYDPFILPKLETGEHRCLPVTRSVAYLRLNPHGQHTLDQPNFNTAFLDMAPLYGNDECDQRKLRSFSGGKFNSSSHLMMLLKPAEEFITCRSSIGHCFLSGDGRANENIGLSVLHVLYHRTHNKLAHSLQAINPHWDDERLYQEARRINVAQYQHIVYEEYLLPIIGYHTAAKNKLLPHHQGYFVDYDENETSGVYNEFAAAAFRMGHSQVPPYFTLQDPHYLTMAKIPLHTTFHDSSLLHTPGSYEALQRGMMTTPLKPTDLNLIEALNNKLFAKYNVAHSGQDLFALNVARGRDHGLAPYIHYVSLCLGEKVTTFSDLEKLMHPHTVSLLSLLYADVGDIDLFVGGLAELPLPGALVGPTFACIIARQFLKAKTADRFWYEGPGGGFTEDQLKTLRETSLAKVICDTLHEPDARVPRHAFRLPHEESNPLKLCSELPALNLELWREVPFQPPAVCQHNGINYGVGSPVPVSPCLLCVCQPSGEFPCQCDRAGCEQGIRDYHCIRICGFLDHHPSLRHA